MDAATVAVFTGNANPQLAHDIAKHLQMPLGRASVGRFSDEVTVELMENVRGATCSWCSPLPAGERQPDGAAGDGRRLPSRIGRSHHRRHAVLRLCAAGSAPARDASADHGQAGGQHDGERGSAPAADGGSARGPDPGFFDIPVDNVYASPVLLGEVWKKYDDLLVVAPDVGGVVRARAIAKRLDDADLAIIDKRRPRANESVMNIIGEVEGKTCVLVDDLVDTAGTLCHAASALKDVGAKSGGLHHASRAVGSAVERIEDSVLDQLVVTDTIPLREEARACRKIRQLSVAGLLAETMPHPRRGA